LTVPEELAAIINGRNIDRLLAKLNEIVPEYSPSPEILALAESKEISVS